MLMRISGLFLFVLSVGKKKNGNVVDVLAFSPCTVAVPKLLMMPNSINEQVYRPFSSYSLSLDMVSESTDKSVSESSSSSSSSSLSEDEWKVVTEMYEKSSKKDDDGKTLEEVVRETLPTLDSVLIMKLRDISNDPRDEFQAVAVALNNILDASLSGAKDVLAELLDAGEIRKLDALIGKNAREGKLDAAFFQVLTVNLQDAAAEAGIGGGAAAAASNNEGGEENPANRFQILKHVYTRCQEEVEKTIPPGVALLNKLLRTNVDSIRANQLEHYLCTQPNVIKTPDGKELELKGREQILVPHTDFIEAIGNAVKQIRTVETAGAADQEMAANMVESIRQVAKEARIVIGEHFGRESDELKKFEEGLQPVFRPSSPESPFIKGVQGS